MKDVKKVPSEGNTPSLGCLQDLTAFQEANEHVFPSVASLRWFYRQHRTELLQAGAVVQLTGRVMIHAPLFAGKALEIGARVAAKRAEL